MILPLTLIVKAATVVPMSEPRASGSYQYFAPQCDYPIHHFKESTNGVAAVAAPKGPYRLVVAIARGFHSIVLILYRWFRLRSLHSVFAEELGSSDIVEFGHDWRDSRRKRVSCNGSRALVIDLNFAFFDKAALGAIRCGQGKKTPFVCSIALLRFSDIVKAIIEGTRIALPDLDQCVVQDPIGATISNLLKYRSIASYMNRFPHLLLCLFWENRGFQNCIADEFPERTCLFVVGDQGKGGTIYLNHRSHRFRCRAFFSSYRMFRLVGSRFPPERSRPETLVDLSLASGSLSRLLQPSSFVDDPRRTSPRYCFLQSHADFNFDRLSKLSVIGPDLVVLPHPEFLGRAHGFVSFDPDLHYFSQSTVFLFSDVTSSAYQCWLAGYNIAYVEMGSGNNCLADLNVGTFSISNLAEDADPLEAYDLFNELSLDLRLREGFICLHQDLESLLTPWVV